MRYLYTIFYLLFSFALFAQDANPVAEKIAEYHSNKAEFSAYDLFSEENSPVQSTKYQDAAKDVVVFTLNKEELRKLIAEKPEVLVFSFPYKEREITVELFKKEIFAEGFEAVDQNKNKLDYEPGVYYRGIVKNDPLSLVAFSFFKDEIIGVAAALGTGNVVVGKAKDADLYLSYTDHTLTKQNPFQCGVEALSENENRPLSSDNNQAANQTLTTNCVRIYYEIAYQPFVDNGLNTTATINWITAVHNNIATLYANDNIQISLSDILVWTTPDPYVYNYSNNLSYFRNYRTSFDGDLGHLVNSPSTTSVAYLNSLCSGYRYAYSGISHSYQNVPVYSWTIQAMTHEMGHALGSPHTHACEWNGNYTAIDGCGPAAGYSEGCDAPLPSSGTIMSYCHLLSNVGINLANGFGAQPAQLIQNTINAQPCLGTNCTNSCTANVSDVSFSNISTSSATATLADSVSTTWEYRVYPYGNWPTTFSTTTTNPIVLSNLYPNTYYILEVGNVCSNGSTISHLQRIFLTDGDYCNGAEFVDTGGKSQEYGNQESFTKTFYPDGNGTLTLTFSAFDLELGYDFMTLYDGEDLTAPAFVNGENLSGHTIPGPFAATNPAGAITVEFSSDQFSTENGWVGTFTCTPLGVDSFATTKGIMIYPNPSSSWITIASKLPLEKVSVHDISGRLILEKDNLNAPKTNLQLGSLSNGVYFVRVTNGKGSQLRRIIKQ